MHAFGANGNMKKYSNELEILEEFYQEKSYRSCRCMRTDKEISTLTAGAHQKSYPIEAIATEPIKFIELVIMMDRNEHQ